MLACGLGGIDDFPAFVESGAGRNLDSGVLAVLHGTYGHGDVPIPGCSDVNDVEVELSQVFEVPLAFAETRGLWLAGVGHGFLSMRYFLRHQIADGLDLDVLNREQIFQQTAA